MRWPNSQKKSNDNNKLEQKVELHLINTTKKISKNEDSDENLVFMKSGITSVSEWIANNIGNSSTFFQSCMHTQNSDNDLFSMNFKDQKELGVLKRNKLAILEIGKEIVESSMNNLMVIGNKKEAITVK